MLNASNPVKGNVLSPNGPSPAHGQQIQDILDATYEKYKNVDDGKVATYIPELGKADPSHFGICLATVDGHVFRVGDWD
jgi:glutaminase